MRNMNDIRRFISRVLHDVKHSASPLLEAAGSAADTQVILASLVHKFPQDFATSPVLGSALAFGVVARALADRQLFWHHYTADASFEKLVLNNCVAHKHIYFDFIGAQALREHLKPELQDADVLVFFDDALYTIELNKLDVAIKLANNADELMTLAKHVSKKV